MNDAAVVTATPGSGLADGARGSSVRKGVILSAAVLGNLASMPTLLLYTVGIFISRLQQDFGWSRTDTALSATWFTLVLFVGTPLIGRVADRVDPARLAALSLLAAGSGLVILPRLIHGIGALWAFYVVLAVIGLGTSPVVVNKPVVATFSSRRGLAIGVALAGQGIGAFVAPRLAAAVIERGGWQLGYASLGVVAIVLAPIIWFGLASRPSNAVALRSTPILERAGMSFGAAFRSPVFWLLSAISILAGLGMSGAVAHLVPFLRDHSLSAPEAASLASLLGLSNIVGRFVTGFTLDRVDGPFPGLPFVGIGAIGLLLLVYLGAPAAAIAVLLLGFTVGSEFDLLAYFTSRYFGLRAYATVFGWNYAMVAFGAALAPALLGILRDHQGNYVLGFTLSSACLALAALLCPFLGRYRYAP
jgi:MFS family permease